ncbi:hypothetical protein [Chryseobacterium phocaeense]|uniref:hypothetical protein n=1 Tax=Chryseobacterium phocaeense TaxID=1816690 RepID=UPI0009BAC06D|nr:hypothetical protein [Chryseobacterium phocaeense]
MIQKINEVIVEQRSSTINTENIYIIDYKNINNGIVEVLENQPGDSCVHLTNEHRISIYYVAFNENALKVNTPEGQVKQCECILFPTTLNENDWILFVETKYANNHTSAFLGIIDHPNTSIKQIVSTVEYFRNNEIIPKNKKVFAIVSFPKIIEPFSEAFLTRSELTLEEIAINHKILLRPTNKGIVKSLSRIKL